MVKITIDARMINHSGIGVYLRNLIDSLADIYQLTLLGNSSEINKSVSTANFNIIDCDSPIYSLKEQFEIPFKVPQCDLFISPHYNIPLLPVKANKRLVIVCDVYHLVFSGSLSLLKKIYSKLMINMSFWLSDCVITISEFSKSEIRKYISHDLDKIRVVYFGLDKEKIARDLTRAANKFPSENFNFPGKYILFVGNVKPNKNLTGLLKAFELLLKNRADYKLLIVGKKEGFITTDNEVFRIIEKNRLLKENVIFTGYVENKEFFKFYKFASALVFPSFYEGFGIPPLEAMACDCPVIASDSASIPEICGDAALYVKSNDYEDIACKIELLLNNEALRKDLISKGKERLKKFSLLNFSHNLQEVITGILNSK